MKHNYNDLVVIIPALSPDEKMIVTVKNLKDSGFSNIIIINDGSDDEYNSSFEAASKAGAKVILKHSINLGQGRAFKTGFNYYLEHYPDTVGVIECDADGQHNIDDIIKCADLLLDNPNDFILGVRDFNSKNVPFRSRFGNKCTNFVFKYFCGLNIRDTQSGLKGIPRSFIPALMETPGERFEYASSVLLECKKRNVSIKQFDIQTIYINENETSHFNPLLDSIRIYSLILKYMLSSFSSFLIDIACFSLLLYIFKRVELTWHILFATIGAKLISCTYTFFVNKYIVFGKKRDTLKSSLRFITLCIVQAMSSAVLVTIVWNLTGLNEVFVKIIVDTLLFFVSFHVQQVWVFN